MNKKTVYPIIFISMTSFSLSAYVVSRTAAQKLPRSFMRMMLSRLDTESALEEQRLVVKKLEKLQNYFFREALTHLGTYEVHRSCGDLTLGDVICTEEQCYDAGKELIENILAIGGQPASDGYRDIVARYKRKIELMCTKGDSYFVERESEVITLLLPAFLAEFLQYQDGFRQIKMPLK